MHANEKVIWSLLDCFRGSNWPRDFETLEFCLQLLAWAKLSNQKQIPETLRLTETTQLTDVDELGSIFSQLSEQKSLGENRAAFDIFLGTRRKIEGRLVSSTIEIVWEFAQSGNLRSFEIPESCFYDLTRLEYLPFVPPEVSDLMIALGNKLSKKQVYCPYDMLCFLARRVDAKGAKAHIESLRSSPMPWLTNILSNTEIQAKEGDPVRQPNYLKKDGKLEEFDIAISLLPLGKKYEREVVKQDWFDRFPDKTSSGSVLQIRHILKQTKERAVIVVLNSALFSGGAERSLREDLINQGVVETIISLPPAVLPFTGAQISILVLNLKGGLEEVRFVDGANEQFSERDGRGRSRLINWEDLYEAVLNSTNEEIARNATKEEILKNDTHLEVSRYLIAPEQRKAEQYFQGAKVTKLENLVNFVRPYPKIQGEEGVTAFEVGVADFPDFGYLATPQRKITLTKSDFSAKEVDTFLKPGDIVMATKGSTGKIALVPDSVPPAGKGGWVVNQSCLIIRSIGQITPKALFMYLRSDLGQSLLRMITSGATIPLIQLRMLQKLDVILLSAKEFKEIEKTFDTQAELQKKIENLRQEQYRLSKVHWGID